MIKGYLATHAVTGRYNGLIETQLLPDTDYRIVTLKNLDYRKSILELTRHWSSCRTMSGGQVPRCDTRRLEIIHALEDEYPLEGLNREQNLSHHKQLSAQRFE